ncbi:MAG: TonB-dependent receptor [Crocinitomicaceae bacterium]|nr:TonB-dependent receptor [Crocinitomicaceae bacterium]
MKINVLLFIISLLISFEVSAQLTQSVRGSVVDEASLAPLPGVKIIVLGTTQTLGAISDFDGSFTITKVPIGRLSIQVTFFGYETKIVANLDLTAGKELILNIQLSEKLTVAEEVVITGRKKGEVANEMAAVSARTFSIEASQRYAGSVNDVARMAQSFAGVQGNDDSRNDIIVRGNSPIGVLYRYEGVDIPNPNHFALLGTAGGPVSILNNNVLANSDFFTGAFPAEYGNAMAAVFDLKMRNGNDEKHEFLGQIGINGLEVMAEGPLSKNKKSSYLFSYRYSTLQVFSLLGVNFGAGTAVPDYQDINFKLNFEQKKGSTSIFGLGGLSNVEFEGAEADGSVNLFSNPSENLFFYSKIGVVGIKNIYRLTDKAYLKTTISTSATLNNILRDSLLPPYFQEQPSYRNISLEGKNNINTQLNYKFNARHLLRTGIVMDRLFFRLADSIFRVQDNEWNTLTDFDGSTFVIQPFSQWQFKLSEKFTFTAGLHFQYFMFNGANSLEPRGGINYQFAKNHRFGFGYGKHSQVPPTRVYFRQVQQPDGTSSNPNENLGMTKADHFIFTYDYSITRSIRLKTELYYQQLYNVPIDVKNNAYSLLNFGANYSFAFPDSLVNGGTGRNYGVEITFEHFMDKGFYFLFTTSLYESTYTGSNGKRFGTAFNGNYTFNLLGGKEFFFQRTIKKGKKERVKSLLIDARVTLNGGQRYTPVHQDLSMQLGFPIYEEERTNALQYPDYFRADARIAFKVSTKKVTQEWAVDFRNITNHANLFTQEFDVTTGEFKDTYQIGFLPIGQWRITF